MTKGEYLRILAAVLVLVAVGLVMVLSGSANPNAMEMLSNHHPKSSKLDSNDNNRLEELTRLASAAQSEAKQATALKSSEAQKLRITPESKVDAELMLAREAQKKSKTLKSEISSIHSKVRIMRKKMRKDNHAAREEGRLLHKVQGTLRDSMLSLHDKEMKVPFVCAQITARTAHFLTTLLPSYRYFLKTRKVTAFIQVLEARHDVQNAAKAGNVAVLRDAQRRLAVPRPAPVLWISIHPPHTHTHTHINGMAHEASTARKIHAVLDVRRVARHTCWHIFCVKPIAHALHYSLPAVTAAA